MNNGAKFGWGADNCVSVGFWIFEKKCLKKKGIFSHLQHLLNSIIQNDPINGNGSELEE
jgi:hypothetical protein